VPHEAETLPAADAEAAEEDEAELACGTACADEGAETSLLSTSVISISVDDGAAVCLSDASLAADCDCDCDCGCENDEGTIGFVLADSALELVLLGVDMLVDGYEWNTVR